MADEKPRSLTRKSVLLYPDTKEKFDELHRRVGLENHSATVSMLVDYYVRNNEKVRV